MDGTALLAEFRKRASSNSAVKEKLPSATPRLLAVRKPPGATAAPLQFLPFTNDYMMKEEIGKALKNLVMAGGMPDPAALKALSDPLPVRRIAAAEALVDAGTVSELPAVRKLLKDADGQVRLSVALALAFAQDREAVPVLIELVAELPRTKAWEAEDVLHFLAGDKAPPRLKSDTAAARKELREAWQAWWKTNGAELNMAELGKTRGGLGLTLVAEITILNKLGKKVGVAGVQPVMPPAGITDRVVVLDPAGQPQWQIDNLAIPLDVQRLSGNRVLIAEYSGRRITERDTKGTILWQVNVPGSPINVQRLANGNTFIALYNTGPNGDGASMEVDPAGKTVAMINLANNQAGPGGFIQSNLLIGGHKMADGQIVCVTLEGSCLRLDATGKVVNRFPVQVLNGGTVYAMFGNIDVTDKGHVIIAQNDNTVAEYDTNGKIVWQSKHLGNLRHPAAQRQHAHCRAFWRRRRGDQHGPDCVGVYALGRLPNRRGAAAIGEL